MNSEAIEQALLASLPEILLLAAACLLLLVDLLLKGRRVDLIAGLSILVVLAVAIQVVSVALRLSGPALLLAVFVGLFWMPALLVAATSQAFAIDRRRAVGVAIVPYLIWVLVVGRSLYTQIGHLL